MSSTDDLTDNIPHVGSEDGGSDQYASFGTSSTLNTAAPEESAVDHLGKSEDDGDDDHNGDEVPAEKDTQVILGDGDGARYSTSSPTHSHHHQQQHGLLADTALRSAAPASVSHTVVLDDAEDDDDDDDEDDSSTALALSPSGKENDTMPLFKEEDDEENCENPNSPLISAKVAGSKAPSSGAIKSAKSTTTTSDNSKQNKGSAIAKNGTANAEGGSEPSSLSMGDLPPPAGTSDVDNASIGSANSATVRAALTAESEDYDKTTFELFEKLKQQQQQHNTTHQNKTNLDNNRKGEGEDTVTSGSDQGANSRRVSPRLSPRQPPTASSPSAATGAAGNNTNNSNVVTTSSLIPKDLAKKQSQKSVADIKRLAAATNMQKYIAPAGEADAWGRNNKRKITGKHAAWEQRAWFFPINLCLVYVIPALRKAAKLGNDMTAKEMDPLVANDQSTGAYMDLHRIIYRLSKDDEEANELPNDDDDDERTYKNNVNTANSFMRNNNNSGNKSSSNLNKNSKRKRKRRRGEDDDDEEDDDAEQEVKLPRTLGAALMLFIGWGHMGVMWSMLYSACPFGIVALLDYVSEFIDDPSQPVWKGYMYAGFALLCQLTQAFAKAQMERTAGHVRARIHGALLMTMMQRCCRPTNPQDAADAAAAAKEDEDYVFEDDGSGMPPIIQLVTSDCENIAEMIPYLLFNATQAIEIVIAFIYLLVIAGWPAVFPILVFLILVPFNKRISDKFMDRYESKAAAGDGRASKVEEVMSNIRTIKYYAWEWAMERDITGLRNIEVLCLRSLLGFMVAFSCMCAIATPLMQLSLFAAIYFGPANQGRLDSTAIYQAISLLSIPAWNLSVVPYQIGEWTRLSVSLKRLSRYLNDNGTGGPSGGGGQGKDVTPEMPSMYSRAFAESGNLFDMYADIEPKKVKQSGFSSRYFSGNERMGGASQRYGDDGLPVYGVKGGINMAGAVFVHNTESLLEDVATADGITNKENADAFTNSRMISGRDVNRATLPPNSVSAAIGAFALRIDEFVADPGELILVVGKVGSGKSSLLASVLGQMICANSQFASNFVDGKISIVPQSPWILNGTVRNNIILDNTYNEAKYQLCLAASALAVDLSLFGNGDATMVGAKGATLSGGQRQRLSIARALYREADIYIFDDSLSALDATVGRQVFDNAICGLLKSKTRIVVTHQLGLLPMADRIYVVDDGNVVQQELPEIITAEPEEDEGPLAALLRAWKESVDVLAAMEGGEDDVDGAAGEEEIKVRIDDASLADGSEPLIEDLMDEVLINSEGSSSDSSDEKETRRAAAAVSKSGIGNNKVPPLSLSLSPRRARAASIGAISLSARRRPLRAGASVAGGGTSPAASPSLSPSGAIALLQHGAVTSHNFGATHHDHIASAAPAAATQQSGANPFGFRTNTLRAIEKKAVGSLIGGALAAQSPNAHPKSRERSYSASGGGTVARSASFSTSTPTSPLFVLGGGGAGMNRPGGAATALVGGKRITLSFSDRPSSFALKASTHPNNNNNNNGTSASSSPFSLPPPCTAANASEVGGATTDSNAKQKSRRSPVASYASATATSTAPDGSKVVVEKRVVRTDEILAAVKTIQESENETVLRVVSAACELTRPPTAVDQQSKKKTPAKPSTTTPPKKTSSPQVSPQITPRSALKGSAAAATAATAVTSPIFRVAAGGGGGGFGAINNDSSDEEDRHDALRGEKTTDDEKEDNDLSRGLLANEAKKQQGPPKKKTVHVSSVVITADAEELYDDDDEGRDDGDKKKKKKKNGQHSSSPPSADEPSEPMPPNLVDVEQFTDASVISTLGRYLITCGGCGFWVQMFNWHFLTVAFSVAGSWWLGQWAEEKTFGLEELAGSLAVLGIYAGALIVSALIVLIREFAWREGCLRPPTVLFDRMTHAILAAPVSFFDVNPLGRILTRFTKDIDQIDYTIPTATNELFVSVAAQIGSLVAICITLPYFTPLAVLVVIGVPLLRPSHSLVVLRRVADASLSPVTEIFSEAASGTASIVILKLTRLFMRRLQKALDEYNAARYMDKIAFEFVRLRVSIMMSVIGAGVIIVMTILRDTVNPATAGFVISQTVNITNFLSYMVEQLGTLTLSLNSVARVNDYCEIEPERGGTDVPPAGWPRVPIVEFKSVRAQYRPDLPIVIKNLNITLAAGEKIGVCGRTGSGKSTLIQCLLRMVPMLEGSHVIIDGLDTAGLDVKHLRRRLTVIPQEPVIFEGTLRYNLDPIGDHKDERLLEVLYDCQVHVAMRKMFEGGGETAAAPGEESEEAIYRRVPDSARSLPRVDLPAADDLVRQGGGGGEASRKAFTTSRRRLVPGGNDDAETESQTAMLFSPSNDRGEPAAEQSQPLQGATLLIDCLETPMSASSLSVGQKQLLCLARAVLRGTNVLILDEATSSVDAVTDQLIQTVIRTVFDGCTVLTIAHRINTIVDSDRILVMDKGTVAEFDTPSNLLKDPSSIFSTLVRQSKEEH